MSQFDYTARAELFPARASGLRRHAVSYKKFDTAADAIRFAVEELDPALLTGAILEVDEERFDGAAIRNLYASAQYPLKRGAAPAGDKR